MDIKTLRTTVFAGLFFIPFITFFVYGGFFFPFITTKAFVFRIIVEIIFGAWILLTFLDETYRPKRSVILYSLFIFLGIIGLADLFGMAPIKSFWSNFERMEGYVTLLHLGALFLVMGSVLREIDWKRWWNTSLFASFLLTIYCLLQLSGLRPINQGGVRVDGTLGNASYLAVYMLFHVFIALYFMYRSRQDATMKWIYGILIFLQVFVLYHTATRGAILGLLGGLLTVGLLNIKGGLDTKFKKISIAGIVLLIVLVGGFMLVRNSRFVLESPVLARFATISTEELKSGGRSFVWPMAIKGVKENPLLGWGQENFNYIFNKYYEPEMYNLEPWFDRAHNIFLDWAVAGGILGLISYLSLYVGLLYLIWWKNKILSHEERSILTGLLVAYFFHNFFVFDNLISYILFFALLAYIHSQNDGGYFLPTKDSLNYKERGRIALPVTVVFSMFVIYFFNISPIITNAHLIKALASTQGPSTGIGLAITKFEDAYNGSRLGRPEVVEQIARLSPNVFLSELPIAERSAFFDFARKVISKQADSLQTDARYQIIAGSFLSTTGFPDEALKYFERAKELSPGKQLIYFEIGATLVNKGNSTEALESFKYAYDLAPQNQESGIIYTIGAIYAGDRVLESKLLATLPPRIIVLDQRILSAYMANKRYTDAIVILQKMGEMEPSTKAQADEYIRRIQAGEI